VKAEFQPRHGDYARVPLGSVTEIIMGQAPPGSDCNKEGRGTVFVKAGEFDDRFPLICEWTTRPLKLARAGDVLVCVVGATAGKINEAIDCAIGRSVASVRPLEHVSSGFLYHFLSTRVQFLRAKSQGLAQGVITREMLQQLEFPLPPLAEQRRIAEVLDRADALRAKRRAALAQLDSLTQSIFLDLFGDPARNTKGWPVSGIEDVCELIVDCVNRTAPIVDGPTPFKMIRTTNVKAGKVNLGEVRHVTEEVFNRWNRRATPRRGDVLLTREAPVGEAGMIESDDCVFLGQRLMLYRANRERMTPEYLLASFRGAFFQHQFNRYGSGSTVKHLPLPACRRFQVYVPPIDLQREFSRRVEAIEKLKRAQRASLAQLDALFASLQHRAFRGEL
jgi:type I restriction enzyme, S subunit